MLYNRRSEFAVVPLSWVFKGDVLHPSATWRERKHDDMTMLSPQSCSRYKMHSFISPYLDLVEEVRIRVNGRTTGAAGVPGTV